MLDSIFGESGCLNVRRGEDRPEAILRFDGARGCGTEFDPLDGAVVKLAAR